MVQLKIYAQENISEKLFANAFDISKNLLDHLNENETQKKISAANMPGKSSSEIQSVFKNFTEKIGFVSEKKGLFKDAPNQLLRPDYYLRMDDNNGIILEVERGKVTINNMDLLDFWKCHLCSHANILFLMVPNELRQNEKMSPRKEFNTVKNRMSSFFEPNNYTNVDALFLFGY